MMEPSESLARQARKQYGMQQHGYQPSWIPFLPPFTSYDEIPSPPLFMAKNPVHDGEWVELASEQERQSTVQKCALGLVAGFTIAAFALMALLLIPFSQIQQQAAASLATVMAGSAAESCWCSTHATPGPQGFAHAQEVQMDIASEGPFRVNGSTRVQFQAEQSRPTHCLAFRAAAGVEAWGWQVEGSSSQGTAIRMEDGKHFCVHFNESLPWPSAYIRVHFGYQPSSISPGRVNLSCSDSSHHHEPFAIFPFTDSSPKIIGNTGFDTMWTLNVTAPADATLAIQAASTPLLDTAPQSSAYRQAHSGRRDHLYKATATGVPTVTIAMP